MLADICRDSFTDVEAHLHHDNDTAESLREEKQKMGIISED